MVSVKRATAAQLGINPNTLAKYKNYLFYICRDSDGVFLMLRKPPISNGESWAVESIKCVQMGEMHNFTPMIAECPWEESLFLVEDLDF